MKVHSYPDIIFDKYATSFKCPRCLNNCNCSHCCPKRNEEYISRRGIKVDIAPSAIYAEVLERESRGVIVTKLPSLSAGIHDLPAAETSIPRRKAVGESDKGQASLPTRADVQKCTAPSASVTPIVAAAADVPSASAASTTPPISMPRGEFVGKPRRGWQQHLYDDRDDFPNEGTPQVHAYVGSGAPIAMRSAIEYEERMCISGPLASGLDTLRMQLPQPATRAMQATYGSSVNTLAAEADGPAVDEEHDDLAAKHEDVASRAVSPFDRTPIDSLAPSVGAPYMKTGPERKIHVEITRRMLSIPPIAVLATSLAPADGVDTSSLSSEASAGCDAEELDELDSSESTSPQPDIHASGVQQLPPQPSHY